MNLNTFIFPAIVIVLTAFSCNALDKKTVSPGRFDMQKDILLLHCDFKTDVDDLQTVAAFATLLHDSGYTKINHHVVAGTYGTQEGLYVPPNSLLELAFPGNWTDAHQDVEAAVTKVKGMAEAALANQGDVWISEAGQSDFTAQLLKAIQADWPERTMARHIHVVQHAEWNEMATSPEGLAFVEQTADYHKIPDGNGVGNGTPGFRDPAFTQWQGAIEDPTLREIWQRAIDLSNEYNGQEGRYYNEAIAAGGLDFSDLAAVCWILGLHDDIKDTEGFFNWVAD